MHLFFCSVVFRLWELFASENGKIGHYQPWVISKAVREVISREIRAGRWTVPRNQARLLLDIRNHS